MSRPACDRDMLRRAAGLFLQAGSAVEVRIPKPSGRKRVVAGFYDDIEALVKDVAQWSGKAEAIYCTLNPVNRALLAVACNRLEEYANGLTTDALDNIVCRRWLLIDVDACRPKSAFISSTEAEHQAALARASAIRKALQAQGWPDPVCGDSGNGAHLLYAIELPNDDAAHRLIKRVLQALDLLYSDATAVVDVSVENASRISKLYGSLVCKGDCTTERPHRMARLLEVPETLQIVSVEQLEKVAAYMPEAPAASPKTVSASSFDLETWIREHGLPVVETGAWNGGRKWILNPCPWDPSHTNRAAYLLQFPNGAIAAGCRHNGCDGKDWHTLRDLYEPGWREKKKRPRGKGKGRSEAGEDGDEDGNETTAQHLVAIGRHAERFHSDRDEGFVRLEVKGHKETWPVRSRPFRDWLARQFYQETERVPGGQATEDALRVLEGDCRFDGVERTLSLRCARDTEGGVWIDCADADWQALHVTPDGWLLVPDPPPLFRRYSLSAAHVLPARGGSLEALRPFLNVKNEAAWVQLIAWLVAAFFPEIAHPVLVVHGEQGSAKSSLMRLLSLLIDPSRTPLRTEPRDAAEWVQTADHSWLVTLDNVSHLPNWLSDAICRAVTGEGFSKRMLYTDGDDVILAFRRVIALTGIEVVAQRPDLLDRSILMPLEPIPPENRRSETEVLAAFEQARPAILGALLDTVAGVLRELPSVQLTQMPRMADFARIGVAVERVLDWEEGTFLSAYQGNIAEQHVEALSASMVGEAVCTFMDGREEWEGTAKDLLEALATQIGDTKARQKEWPKSPRGLSGQLRRIAPNLRGVGIWIEFGERTERARPVKLIRRQQESAGEQPSEPSAPSASAQRSMTVPPDGRNGNHKEEAQPSAGAPSQPDDPDGADGQSPTCSDSPATRLLQHYASLFAAAHRNGLPPCEELHPEDGLPMIYNPQGAVLLIEHDLRALQAGQGEPDRLPRMERDLTVICAWWESKRETKEEAL